MKQAPGTFVWNELMSHDPKRARAFYTGLFGWTVRECGMAGETPYNIFMDGDRPVGGMLHMASEAFEGVPAHWLSYVEVPDVDAAAEHARGNGGTVLAEPFDVPEIGRICVIADPEGAVLALITSTRQD